MAYQKKVSHSDFKMIGEKYMIEISKSEHNCGDFPIVQGYLRKEKGYSLAFLAITIIDDVVQIECSVSFEGVIVFV